MFPSLPGVISYICADTEIANGAASVSRSRLFELTRVTLDVALVRQITTSVSYLSRLSFR